MSTFDVIFTRGGNPVSGDAHQFSIDEAGVPLRDILDPRLRELGPVDVYVRHDGREVQLSESHRESFSLLEALGLVSSAGSTQGGVYQIDTTATHEGASDA
jgi:hypothetical protein